jgi:hypothetical protein
MADLEAPRAMLRDTVPLLRLLNGLKKPNPKNGTWDVITDPEALDGWFSDGDNLAALLGRAKESPVIAVGLDVYKAPAIVEFAQGLGVHIKGASVWAKRTGRGGWTLIYFYNGPELKRDCVQKDSAIDLLTNGYTVIPPSDTSREPDGGGPYRWLPGHSPVDIPLAEPDEPPQALLDWWRSLAAPSTGQPRQHTERQGSPSWLTGIIPAGQRNEVLTKRAGFYHRKISDDEAVRDLLHSANRNQCLPPLPDREVDAILNSILRREGAAHYRPVQPARLERL